MDKDYYECRIVPGSMVPLRQYEIYDLELKPRSYKHFKVPICINTLQLSIYKTIV